MNAAIGTPAGSSHAGSSDGHCAADTVKREFGCAAFRPALPSSGVQSLPCQSMRCAGGVRVMPSHHTSPSSVSATLVKITLAFSVSIAFGLDSYDVPGATPKKPGFRIDRAEPVVGPRLDPGDVVADGRDLPAFEARRRDQHREVGLAARARERRADVGLLAVRRGHAEDQHVLGEPALLVPHHRRDAQREALLAEQRVAAVARAERPDLARLGKMHDVLVLAVAGPRHVALAGLRAASPTECTQGTNGPSSPSTSNTARPMRVIMRMLATT